MQQKQPTERDKRARYKVRVIPETPTRTPVSGKNSGELNETFLWLTINLHPRVSNIGIIMIFHSLTFARSRRRCWKPRAKPEVFNISRGTLRMLMNDKIIFDRYYCISSKKTHRKLTKCLRTLFFSLTIIFLRAHSFYKYPRFGPWQDPFSHDDLKA